MKIAIFGEHPGIRPPATFLIVSTYLHMYILVDTYVHILRTRWECTSTTSPSWWTPPPTGQSVFFHDALLLFILFKNALPLSAFTLFANRLLTNVLFALSLILPALLLSKK